MVTSWNTAGVSFEKVQDYLNSFDGRKSDIWLLQEVARAESGWAVPLTCGKFILQRYQGLDTWRGLVIAYDSEKFIARKRKACEHGIWLLLEAVGTGKPFWLGSGYLSTGIPQDAYELQHAALLRALPVTTHPVLIGGDWNVPFSWRQVREGESGPMGSSGKLRTLKDSMLSRRLSLLSQPTHHCAPMFQGRIPTLVDKSTRFGPQCLTELAAPRSWLIPGFPSIRITNRSGSPSISSLSGKSRLDGEDVGNCSGRSRSLALLLRKAWRQWHVGVRALSHMFESNYQYVFAGWVARLEG